MKGLKVLMALILVTTVLAGAASPVAAGGDYDGGDDDGDCTQVNAEGNDNDGISVANGADAVNGNDIGANVGILSSQENDGGNDNTGQSCET